MFEHLPAVTDADVEKMMEDWQNYLDLMTLSIKRTKTLNEAMDSTCAELSLRNPKLVGAVRNPVFSILGLFKDKGEPERSGAAMTAVPTVLAVLCLIDRALEAKELDKLTSEGEDK